MNEQQQKRATVNKTLAIEKLRSTKKRIPVESVQLSVSSSGSPGQTHAITMLNGKGWQVLPELGLCLRNERNMCWFHATLNLLIAIPGVRHNLSCIHVIFFNLNDVWQML